MKLTYTYDEINRAIANLVEFRDTVADNIREKDLPKHSRQNILRKSLTIAIDFLKQRQDSTYSINYLNEISVFPTPHNALEIKERISYLLQYIAKIENKLIVVPKKSDEGIKLQQKIEMANNEIEYLTRCRDLLNLENEETEQCASLISY